MATKLLKGGLMKFNIYYFENYPLDTPFDMNNPRYVLSQEEINEILTTIISNKPYSLSIDNFKDKELINQLLHIDVLQSKDNKLALAIPFFIEKDIPMLEKLSKKVASEICSKLINHKEEINKIIEKVNNGFDNQRNLYHLLCGYIFDGLLFDYLEENNLVTTSLLHKSNLDYLVILYEDSELINEYSNKLLCSYNRLIDNSSGFVSFGDSEGNRKDFYRYYRLKELNKLPKEAEEYLNYSPSELIKNFNKLIDKENIDKEYLQIFEYFEYTRNHEIAVPIYTQKSYKVASELYQYILTIIKEPIHKALSHIQNETELTCISHQVNTKDIANEIYHLIFGEVNEQLIQNGFVSNPSSIQDEGRYFRCFER